MLCRNFLFVVNEEKRMFVLPARQVSAVSSSNTYKRLFSCLFGWGFCAFSCIFNTGGAFWSVHTQQTNKQLIYTHHVLQISIPPSFLGRRCCLKNHFKESWRHSRNLPVCHLNYNYTKCHIMCTTCLVKGQSLFPQAPCGSLPFAKHLLKEIRQFVCESRVWHFSPTPTQRQFRLRSETDAEVVELRKAMMCWHNS